MTIKNNFFGGLGLAMIILSIGGCAYLISKSDLERDKVYINNGYEECRPENWWGSRYWAKECPNK